MSSKYVMPAAARNELHKIEQERNVKIIYACESGSRAWGFASDTSDYDIRFIYVRPPRAYLSLASRRDVIDQNDLKQNDPMLDLSGWDILKFLEQAAKSNPQVLEWLHTHLRYYQDDQFIETVKVLMENFNTRAVAHHYASHAKRVNDERIKNTGEKTLAKSYLYTLRTIVMAILIYKEPETFPHSISMGYAFTRRGVIAELGENLVEEIKKLINLREYTDEKVLMDKSPTIEAFIDKYIELVYDMAKRADDSRRPDMLALEQLSYDTIRRFS